MRGPRVDYGELQTRRAHIYFYVSDGRWCWPWRLTVVWRHGAFFVSRQHSAESDFPLYQWPKCLGFFAVVVGVGKCFLQLNFECKNTFKSKWKRYWLISLKIRAKIEVTKHAFLADDFKPYWLFRKPHWKGYSWLELSKPPVKRRWNGSYPYTSYPHLNKWYHPCIFPFLRHNCRRNREIYIYYDC